MKIDLKYVSINKYLNQIHFLHLCTCISGFVNAMKKDYYCSVL